MSLVRPDEIAGQSSGENSIVTTGIFAVVVTGATFDVVVVGATVDLVVVRVVAATVLVTGVTVRVVGATALVTAGAVVGVGAAGAGAATSKSTFKGWLRGAVASAATAHVGVGGIAMVDTAIEL